MKKTRIFISFEFVKFLLVGLSNTIITAVVIWLLLKVFFFSNLQANILGYIAGLINSFFLNRKWTFKSKTKIKDTIFKFIFIFVVSYLLQLGALSLMIRFLNIDAYWCHLLAISVYTGVNFILNKYYTFKD